MNIKSITAIAALCLLLAQAAAAEKSSGTITLLGDALEFSAGSVGQSDGAPAPKVVDGALGGVAYDILNNGGPGGTDVESGFYSRMVSTPAAFNYSGATASSYTLTWDGESANPSGTSYQAFASLSNAAAPYMVYYSTTGDEAPVTSLYPNTSFYNFILANYMEGDYSVFAATTAVTLALPVSSDTFRFEDVGHNTLNLSFSAFGNPPPVTGSNWQSIQAMPASRFGQASVVYGSHVYVSGGFTGVYASSAVYRAETGAGTLSALQPAGYMPEALYGHQMVAARGRLYVLGGHTQSAARNLVWSADISTDGALSAWEAETPLPDPLYFHAAAVAGNWLYVSGGYAPGGISMVILRFTLDETGRLNSETPVTMLSPRYAHTLTLAGDRLYIVGGNDGASARSEVLGYQLSPDGAMTGSITHYTALPSPRYGHTTLAVGNVLYVMGGNNGSGVQSTVWRSTVAAGMEDHAPWLPYSAASFPARQYAAGAAVGDKLYLFGGYDGIGARNTVYTSSLEGTRYLVEISSDVAFAGETRTSGPMSDCGWSFGGLQPATTYYARAKAVSRLGFETDYSAVAATVTYSAVPGTAAWTDVSITSATVNWLASGNAPDALYRVEYSTSPDYHHIGTNDVPGFSYNTGAGSLLANTTYYARVRVIQSPVGLSRFADLPPVRTGFDPALDLSSPTITNYPSPADDPVWHSTNSFSRDIVFSDNNTNDSGLSRFEIRAATAPGGAVGIVTPWTPVAQGINQGVYSQKWGIPWSVWNLMQEGASNYISIRVYDNVENATFATDAFSVLKDTTPPRIDPAAYVPAPGWYSSYPGNITGLHFEDGVSGLYRLQYSVSDRNDLSANVIGWTDISTNTMAPGATSYDPAPVAYDFSRLENGVMNYFSLRACDVAGTTGTYKAAFTISKNVSGPAVVIATPSYSPAYLSTFSFVSGSAAPSNGHSVVGSEVSLRDVSGGNYYNGSGFLAGSRVWFYAGGAAGTFAYEFGDLPLVNGRHYEVVARSSDSIGDYSQVFATYAFTCDTEAPDARVLLPETGVVYSSHAVSGTAADALSGLSAVYVGLRRVSDNKWWNGSDWDAAAASLPAGNSAAWNWNFDPYLRDRLVNGAQYYVTARAADNAHSPNAGAFDVSGATFTYADTTPPPRTLTLAAAAGSRAGTVLLSWLAPGDNSYAPGLLLAGNYKIAYSTYAGAPVSTDTALITIATTSVTAGTTQSRLIENLDAGASYYFTLWTEDDALNWSPPSAPEAVAIASTLNSGALTGNVADASTQAVTGVLVEALGPTGAVEGSDYTNTSGNYSLAALESDILTVHAVWAAQDIESSVSKDGIPNGSSGVNFRLSVTYQLAAISGVIPAGYMPQGRSLPASGSYTTREVRPSETRPFAEIYRKGRRIGAAFTDSRGSFQVPNLLPGSYSVRVYNGTAFSKMQTVVLHPGENLVFAPEWELLNTDKVYAYPNPAGAWVHFHFATMPADAEAQLDVFDITGRLIKTFRNAAGSPVWDNTCSSCGGGDRMIAWDLSGEKVASGVYVYVLRVKSGASMRSIVKKFAIIR